MTKIYQVPVRCKTKVTMFFDHWMNVSANSEQEALDKAIAMDLEQKRAALSDNDEDFEVSTTADDLAEMEHEALRNSKESHGIDVLDGIEESDVVEKE